MKNRILLVLCLVGVSLLFGLPHLYIPKLLQGGRYSPLGGGGGAQSAIVTEEVYTYVPEVQERLEGKKIIRDTQLAEYMFSPSPFIGETVPTYIMAGLSAVTGSTAAGFTVADFLFPPVALGLVYLLGKKLGLSGGLALLAALITVVAGDLISLMPYPKPTWEMLVDLKGKDDFLFFSRNFHPQLSFPLFILALLSLILALKSRGFGWGIVAGVVIGIQFYTYLFNWTTLVLSLFGLGAWWLITGRKQWIKQVVLVGVVAFLVAIPYFYEMFQFRSTPYANDFFLKSSLPARTFFPVTARYAILIVAVWMIVKNKSLSLIVLTAVSLSAVMLPELAVLVFGQDLEGKHWMRRILMPMSILLAVKVVNEIYLKVKSRPKLAVLDLLLRLGFVLVIFVLIQFGFRVQIAASQRYAYSYYLPPEKDELLSWIKNNIRLDESIASLDISLLAEIPALTQGYNVVPITIRSMATTEESLDRFLRVAGIYQLSEESIRQLLVTGGFASRLLYFQAIDEGVVFRLSDERLRNILLQYRNVLKEENVKMFPYRLDYVVVGPVEKDIMRTDFENNSFFKRMFSNQRYKVYKVING